MTHVSVKISSQSTVVVLLAACVLSACNAPSQSGSKRNSVTELPPEQTDVIFADGYAHLFLAECRKHVKITTNGVCERLLYSERAKQVWSGEVYAQAHSVPLGAPAPGWGQAFRRPDSKEIYAAIPYVPDPQYANQAWIQLADMRHLSDDEASAVAAAFTRTKFLKWEDLKSATPPHSEADSK